MSDKLIKALLRKLTVWRLIEQGDLLRGWSPEAKADFYQVVMNEEGSKIFSFVQEKKNRLRLAKACKLLDKP